MGEDGGVTIRAPEGVSLRALRERLEWDPAVRLDVLAWIDAWAAAAGLPAQLAWRDTSLWWYVRLPMFRHAYERLLDVAALGQALDGAGARALVLEQADPYWREVAECVGRTRGVPVQVERGVTRAGASGLAHRLGMGLALAGRAAALPFRAARHGGAAGKAPILTLLYAVSKRVEVDGTVRYMQPTYELPIRALERRGLAPYRLSAPLNFHWRQEFFWLRHGDPTALPVEPALGAWLAGQRLFHAGGEAATLLPKFRGAVASAPPLPRWRGWDVEPLVRPFLARALLPRARRALQEIEFFRDFLQRRRFRVAFINGEYSGLAMALSGAARSLGIPVVAAQHGQIWQGHVQYAWPAAAEPPVPRPDRMCVFGQFERDLLVEQTGFRADQVVVTGSPHFDAAVNRGARPDRAKLAAAVGFPADIPMVLYSSNGESNDLDAREIAERVVASPGPVGVIVKLHPTQSGDPAPFAAEAARHRLPYFRVINREHDVFDLMQVVDAHASTWSTTVTEAVAFGLPNILFRTAVNPDTLDYVGQQVAVAVEAYPSLGDAVADVTRGPTAARLAAGRAAFVARHFHQIDGRAAERVADVVAGYLG